MKWMECSWNKYEVRQNEYCEENTVGNDNDYQFDVGVGLYGLIEDFTMCNCMSVEDVFENVVWED